MIEVQIPTLACGHDNARQIDSAASHHGYGTDPSILLECVRCGHQQWVGLQFTVGQVQRKRLNDCVGPATWGIYSDLDLQEGDRVWFGQEPLFPGQRWYLTVTRVDGRLATVYDGTDRFCGFVQR